MSGSRNFFGKLESSLDQPNDSDVACQGKSGSRKRSSIIHEIEWGKLMDEVRGLSVMPQPDDEGNRSGRSIGRTMSSTSEERNLRTNSRPSKSVPHHVSWDERENSTLYVQYGVESADWSLNDPTPPNRPTPEHATKPHATKPIKRSASQAEAMAQHATEQTPTPPASCAAGATRALSAAFRAVLPARRR